MSYGNQSYLRFSLEESIWFQKGQEVAELVSISLDPNITIQESDQYVTIKGSLELSGEYIRDDQEEEELDYFSNPKFVQSVEVREEGVHLFSHHFPVEITIPKNRMENVLDIDVGVETFDYAFPERSCLKLSADLMITGLYGDLQHERLQEHDELDDIDEELDELDEIDEIEDKTPVLYTPFEVEARKEPVIESKLNEADPKRDDPLIAPFRNEEVSGVEEEDEDEDEYEYENENENEIVNRDEDSSETENSDEERNPFEIKVEVEPEKETFPEITFSSHRNEEQQPSIPVEEFKEELEEETEVVTDTGEDVIEEEVPNEMTDVLDETESTTPQDKKDKGKGDKWKNKQSLTLSEFFARKEEESHTKLTVCIVQNGDTLNSLSERYEVSVAQLQKGNQIELNQDVSEGQVLYIPIAQPQR